jgi:zinc transport system substrate-binding protein
MGISSRLGLFLCFLYFSMPGYAYHALTSIVPIHSIVSQLLQGIDTPDLLLDGKESAHTYALKPQDIKKIHKASVIIWVGPTYETFLKKALSLSKKPTVSILETPHLELLPLRSSCCSHDTPEDHHHHHHSHDHHHHHHSHDHHHQDSEDAITYKDPHIWLDPQQVTKVFIYLHERFCQDLPQKKNRLDQNLQKALNDLKRLHETLEKRLYPLKDRPFMVYHDGYQYLEKAYGLKNLGPLLSHVEGSLSPQDIKTFTNNLKKHPGLCIFSESQFSSKILDSLRNRLSFKEEVLDPIGYGFQGPKAYHHMMEKLAHHLESGLHP